MKIKFIGATGTVTGSKTLVEIGANKHLVDCGLYQGPKALRLKNWASFPFDPKEFHDILLTHAHIDHSGYIPKLVREGFRGKIYASSATTDLCGILLPDSGYLQEEEARYANRHKYSKHHPALPLYTLEEAKASLRQFESVEFEKPFALNSDTNVRYLRAGHILGASMVQVTHANKTITFTGDLGRMEDPLFKAPTPIDHTDYLVIESTYGNRRHERSDPLKEISEVVNRTVDRGGVIIIPAFAVGRVQSLLYYLSVLRRNQQIPDVPIYLNSPMATNTTELLCRHLDDHKLARAECKESCNVAHYIRHPEESKWLNEQTAPMIVISASGMATGGRVIHHLKQFLPDSRNTILFTGFQAAGTRGEALLNGKETIKIHGMEIPVKAEIVNLNSLSAHADYEEILEWLKYFKQPPQKTFIIHGEPSGSDHLKKQIEQRLGWTCVIPKEMDEFEL